MGPLSRAGNVSSPCILIPYSWGTPTPAACYSLPGCCPGELATVSQHGWAFGKISHSGGVTQGGCSRILDPACLAVGLGPCSLDKFILKEAQAVLGLLPTDPGCLCCSKSPSASNSYNEGHLSPKDNDTAFWRTCHWAISLLCEQNRVCLTNLGSIISSSTWSLHAIKKCGERT